jgi:hypothetical protein
MPPTANEQLIEAYFRMVEEDDDAGVGSILTDDATWTIVPIGYTWTGRRTIESMAMAAGRTRRHDERSHIEIKNWFTDGEHLCVEYKHRLVVGRLGLRLTADGYCLGFSHTRWPIRRDPRIHQPAQHRSGAHDVCPSATASLPE